MTREEEIEKVLDDKFDTDLYDYKTDNSYCNYCAGFRQGVEWADAHPNSPWIKYNNKMPEEGIEVIAFHHKWINEDFNPNGTRIGFLNGDKEFTTAYWWDYQDSYITINKSICEDDKDFHINHMDNTEPEYWMPIPKLQKE